MAVDPQIVARAIEEIEGLRRQVDSLKDGPVEPVAVIGVGCRFPGDVRTPDQYWDFLEQGSDGIAPIPPERWDSAKYFDPRAGIRGKMTTDQAGFLSDVKDFDSGFFGISPKEAASIDPQHRILLEVAWETFENASIAPSSLEGGRVGVYVGISNFEYGARLLWPSDPKDITQHSGIGGMLCAAAGRLSYTFGFCGPSMSIDTACSSSLVSTHLACQAIRAGECDMALSAGVNLFFGPQTHINFSQARMLSRDGRCKTFDARADGYGRGEGCGVVLLKRLSAALEDQDHILAMISGSAINQDGPSGGITVPNGPAQERVIKSAIAQSRIDPEEIGYVEAHGTGTPLGDPIEVAALARTFKKRETPLFVGSVKANVGHLESAAGIAGLIKVILMVVNQRIPKQCNFETPSDKIDWDFASMLSIPKVTRSWNSMQPHAGVSSFSFCGTNAHVVVSPSPQNTDPAPTDPLSDSGVILFSAQSEAALVELEGKLGSHFDRTTLENRKRMLATLARGRSHLRFRRALNWREENDRTPFLPNRTGYSGRVIEAGFTNINYLFTGQGSQYPGMGLSLYNRFETFRSSLQELDEVGKAITGWSIIAQLREADDKQPLNFLRDTSIAQPILFALQISLFRLWENFGLRPSQVLGHSVGEFAAAGIAGVFDLHEALGIVIERGRLMQEVCSPGAMIAVRSTYQFLDPILENHVDIELSAVNGAERLVFGGPVDAIDAFAEELTTQEIGHRLLPVDRAFHTTAMHPVVEPFKSFLSTQEFRAPHIPIALNVSGDWAGHDQPNAAYWVKQLTAPVRFDLCMSTLLQQTPALFLEIGPRPVLITHGKEIAAVQERASDSVWACSLHPKRSETEEIFNVVGSLFCAGVDFDWSTICPGPLSAKRLLPNYPFQRKTYWIAETDRKTVNEAGAHPLLGMEFLSPALDLQTRVFSRSLSVSEMPWLAHHQVFGTPILPAAAFLEIMMAASQVIGRPLSIGDFHISQALEVPLKEAVELQTVIELVSGSKEAVRVYSHSITTGWRLHASASLLDSGLEETPNPDLSDRSDAKAIDPDKFYNRMRLAGVLHDEEFRAIKQIWEMPNEIIAKLHTQESANEATEFLIHPASLDAAIQVAAVALRHQEMAFLPVAARRIEFTGIGMSPDTVRVKLNSALQLGDRELIASVDIFSGGRCAAKIVDLVFTRADLTKMRQHHNPSAWCYGTTWIETYPPRIRLDKALNLDVLSGRGEREARKFAEIADHYASLLPDLDVLARRYAVVAIMSLGDFSSNLSGATLSDIQPCTQLPQEQRQQFYRCLQMLLKEDALANSTLAADQNKTGKAAAIKDELKKLSSEARELSDRTSFVCPEIDIVARFGSQLSEILLTKVNPLDLLFPKGNLSDGLKFYQESPAAKALNQVVCRLMAEVIEITQTRGKLRVLEVGAGTGATTASALEGLNGNYAEYCFSDISPLFTRQAEERFGSQDGFSTRILDISARSEEFGAVAGEFDIVIAANVVHATESVQASLTNIQSLLAPGGVLVLLEAQPGQDWLELVFGNITGWWSFSDERLGRSTPLLDAPEWYETLKAAGFDRVKQVAGDGGTLNIANQTILLAQKDQSVSKLVTPLERILVIATERKSIEQMEAITGIERGVFQYVAPVLLESVLPVWEQSATPSPRKIIVIPDQIELSALGKPDPVTQVLANTKTMLGTLQQIGAATNESPIQLTVITVAAVSAGGANNIAINRLNQAVLAMARTAEIEYPLLSVQCIDLDPVGVSQPSIGMKESLRRMVLGPEQLEQAWVRSDGAILEPRLGRFSRDVETSVLPIHEKGVYLITGGLGGLGRSVTEWLLTKATALHIVLLGRSDPNEEERHWLSQCSTSSAAVEYRRVDVTDLDSLRTVIPLDTVSSLSGVVHAAGVLNDQLLCEADWTTFEATLSPKIRGVWNLDQLLSKAKLDFFVTFGSIASVFSPKGQASHAAANAFLDGMFYYKSAIAQPLTHFQWGPWDQVGAASEREMQEGLLKLGITPFKPSEGVDVLERLLGLGPNCISIINVDWGRFIAHWPRRRLLDEIAVSEASARGGDLSQPENSASSVSDPFDSSLAERIQRLPSRQAENLMIGKLTELVAPVLGINDQDQVDVDLGFFDLGLDSLTSVELREAIENKLLLPLDSTSIFKYPTIRSLSGYLVTLVRVDHGLDSELKQESGDEKTLSGDVQHESMFDQDDITNMTDAELSEYFDSHLDG